MDGSALFYASYVVLWVIVVFQAVVLLELVKRVAGGAGAGAEAGPPGPTVDLHEAHRQGELVGTQAPSLDGVQTVGEPLDAEALRGTRVLMEFVSPSCELCASSLPLARQQAERLEAALVLVCRGERESCAAFAAEHGSGVPVVWDEDGALADRLRISQVPRAVLIDEDWTVLKYGSPGAKDGQMEPIEPVPAPTGAQGPS